MRVRNQINSKIKSVFLLKNTKQIKGNEISNRLTLGPNQYDRNLCGIPVVGHFIEVVCDGVIADLVVEAEHEDYGIDPRCEL